MPVKYDPLLSNKTWSLVPSTENMNVVNKKWDFRIKYNLKDTKLDMLLRGFNKHPG